jgi:hypothetical protein
MHKKVYLIINIVFVAMGFALIGVGVLVNFSSPESPTSASPTSSIQKLSNGLMGKIFLQNSNLSEDVESSLVIEIHETESSLLGFQLEIKSPTDMLLYCNNIKFESESSDRNNSYICNTNQDVLTMTLDLEPSPPFSLQIRTLNRQQSDKVIFDYTISNSQGVINQDQLVVTNSQPTSSSDVSDTKLIWYILSGIYVGILIGYLIYLKLFLTS